MSILFRLRPVIFFIRGKIWRVVGILGVIFGTNLAVGLTVIPWRLGRCSHGTCDADQVFEFAV